MITAVIELHRCPNELVRIRRERRDELERLTDDLAARPAVENVSDPRSMEP